MSLKTIRDSFHAQFRNFRNFHRLIMSDNFEIIYDSLKEYELLELKAIVDRVDKKALRKLIKGNLLKLTPFHQMSIRQLREIGRNTNIPKYWNKDKATLIEEIQNVVTRLKKSSK